MIHERRTTEVTSAAVHRAARKEAQAIGRSWPWGVSCLCEWADRVGGPARREVGIREIHRVIAGHVWCTHQLPAQVPGGSDWTMQSVGESEGRGPRYHTEACTSPYALSHTEEPAIQRGIRLLDIFIPYWEIISSISRWVLLFPLCSTTMWMNNSRNKTCMALSKINSTIPDPIKHCQWANEPHTREI